MTGPRERLLEGETLRIRFSEDVGFDIWVERFASPPRVFFEGKSLPIERLDEVVGRIERYLEDEQTQARWSA